MHIESRTITAIVFFLVSTYFMVVLMVWQQSRPLPTGALSDISFDIFPYIPVSGLSDTLAAVSTLATFVYILFFMQHPQRVLQRVLWIWGTIYLMRGITVSVTRLPDPRVACAKEPLGAFVFIEALKFFVHQTTTCSDMLFSGHTAGWITMALVWQFYNRRSWVRAIVWTYVVVGILSLIVTRFHYLVDIVVALFVAFGLHIIYYWAIFMHEMHTPFSSLHQFIQWVDGPPIIVHSLHQRYMEIGRMRFPIGVVEERTNKIVVRYKQSPL